MDTATIPEPTAAEKIRDNESRIDALEQKFSEHMNRLEKRVNVITLCAAIVAGAALWETGPSVLAQLIQLLA